MNFYKLLICFLFLFSINGLAETSEASAKNEIKAAIKGYINAYSMQNKKAAAKYLADDFINKNDGNPKWEKNKEETLKVIDNHKRMKIKKSRPNLAISFVTFERVGPEEYKMQIKVKNRKSGYESVRNHHWVKQKNRWVCKLIHYPE